MSIPTYLKKGDKVAIICPASFVQGDLTPAYDILRNWGLEPVIGETVTAHYHQFAGTDALRAKDLQQALDNPEIKAIIAVRGGYGSVRILDRLDFSAFVKKPKWLVGFSDITALHSHIQRQFAIPTIHGQMIKAFLDASAESLETLRRALFGENIDLEFRAENLPHRNGYGTGILTGGNLAILQSMLASDSDVDFTDKVLFIEDVGESFYNVDRMLWTLKRAKKFDGLKGIIVGSFTGMRDSNPSFGQTVPEIVLDKIAGLDFPVAFGCPAGHIPDNRALILGQMVTLSVLGDAVSIQYIK
ncbi:S66 peptidase family protein [Sphingobacterium sp. Mn56C]|uniref:S66 peptidase family protein n=1 Tax=Sphingobacterium sp. Mn56C TaxID=3395261 RepID=UPI003BCDB895